MPQAAHSVRQRKHGFLIRISHIGLAIAVINQLLTSLVLSAPAPDAAGNFYFEVHEYGGLAAFSFITLFWFGVIFRKRQAPSGLMFPWLSAVRLSALWSDTKLHFAAIRRMRLPPYGDHAPLASAIHGLGLLLVTAMAASGTIYYFINSGDPHAGGLVGVVMFIHLNLANLVWAYLIGHAGLALVHHFSNNLHLSEMWSLRRD